MNNPLRSLYSFGRRHVSAFRSLFMPRQTTSHEIRLAEEFPILEEQLKYFQGTYVRRWTPLSDNMTGETMEMRNGYRRAIAEPMVKAALLGKIGQVAALDLRCIPENTDDPGEKERAEFAQQQLLAFRRDPLASTASGGSGTAYELVWPILSGGLIDGYSVSEKLYGYVGNGRYRGKWTVRGLKSKDTRFMQFLVDPYRNVTGIYSIQGNSGTTYDPNDFVIFSYLSFFSSPTGMSDLRAAYRNVETIIAALKLRMMMLTKYSGPYLKATLPLKDAALRAELAASLQAARGNGYIVVQEGTELEVIDLAAQGTDRFQAAIDDMRKEIAIGMTGAFLQMLEGSAPEQRGDSSVHKTVSEIFVWLLAVLVQGAVNEQIIPDLIIPNYGPDVAMPRCQLGAVDPGEIIKELEIDAKLEQMGFPVSAKDIYHLANRRPPMDDNDRAKPKDQGGGLGGLGGLFGGGPFGGGGGGGGGPAPGNPPALPAPTIEEKPGGIAQMSERPPAKYSSTQIDLPDPIRSALLHLGRHIPDEDLAADGREENPHVTVRYGLHTDSPADVAKAVKEFGPVKLRLRGLSVFSNYDADVLKADVESEDLRRLNEKVGLLDHTDTHPEYHPHATIAYLKKGLGAKYAMARPLGWEHAADSIIFSDRSRNRTSIPLVGDTGKPVTFAEEHKATPTDRQAATPGPDGRKVERLLQAAQAQGVRRLHELVRESLDRLGRGAASTPRLFDPQQQAEFTDSLTKVMATADLLGRSRARERAEQAEARERAGAGVRTFSEDFYADLEPWNKPLARFAEEPIAALAPEAALEYFKGLVPGLDLDPEAFGPWIRRKAFTMAATSEETLLKRVQDIIADRIETGGSMDAYTPAQIDEVLYDAGITPTNPQYGDMVFRTNAMDAYTTGMQEEAQHPDVRDALPVWQYLGINDSRAGDDHRPHFGKYFPNTVSFAEVRGPRVYNCRCIPQPIDKWEWARRQAAGARVEAGPIRTFAEKPASKGGRWITIGGSKGEDGKRAGGIAVYIENGRITKGHPSLAGKKIGSLDDGADTTHRQELRMSRDHAKATWSKKARAEGIEPAHLHSLADELVGHSKAYADEHNAMLAYARDYAASSASKHPERFESLQGLQARNARGDLDASKIRGFDVIADSTARRHPEFFRDRENATEELFQMLIEGNRQPIAHDEAYQQALDTLLEDMHSRPRRTEPDDDVIPFSEGIDCFSEEQYGLMSFADRSHLVRKEIVNKAGRKQVVWVNPNKGTAAAKPTPASKPQATDKPAPQPAAATPKPETPKQTAKQKPTVDSAHDLVKAMQAKPKLEPADVLELVDHLMGLTKAQQGELKQRLGLKASGTKAEIAKKLVARAAEKKTTKETPVSQPAAKPAEHPHDAQVMDAIRKSGREGERVLLKDVRKAATGMTHQEVSDALDRLGRSGEISLYPFDDPRQLRADPEHEKAAVHSSTGVAQHMLYYGGIASGGGGAAVATPAATKPADKPVTAPASTPADDLPAFELPSGDDEPPASKSVSVSDDAEYQKLKQARERGVNADQSPLTPSEKAAASDPKLRPALVKNKVQESYQAMIRFKEFQDGLVEIPRLIHDMQKRLPDATIPEIHDAMKAIMSEGGGAKDTGLELHTLNEVWKLTPEQKAMAIVDNPGLNEHVRYYVMIRPPARNKRDYLAEATQPAKPVEPAPAGKPKKGRN